MSLSSLSAKTDYGLGGHMYSRPRRAPQEKLGESEEREPARAAPEDFEGVLDAAKYASRFRANLAQLEVFASAPDDAPASEPGADDALFEFFGNLSVLLVSVRRGDIDRARAAADALAMELMIEGGAGETGRPHLLQDLRHMVSAAQSGDEGAARAAAKEVARDVRDALEPPYAPPPATAAPSIDATAAAYDTLMAFSEGEAPAPV